jgi:uncharacterized membrane protein YcaP (DUF421 family)
VTTFGLLAVGTSYVVFRSRRAQSVIEGEPLIIVQDGEPIERNLRGERLTLSEVMEQARQHEIASLADVKWAVLETTGQISFIKR